VDFSVTTGGGADLSVTTTDITLEGVAWIDVRQITLDGASTPLDVTWVDEHTWQVTLPLQEGPNTIELLATDLRGELVGRDSILVTSTPP
jgi:hypothetical protein